jgi:hypothetical protein
VTSASPAHDASFCAAGVKVGLVVSAARLGSWISPAVASDLVLTGRTIDGREAERLTVVSRSVPSGEVLDAATASATMIAERAPLAVSAAKRAIRATAEHGFDEALARETAATAKLTASEDHKRAVAAFLHPPADPIHRTVEPRHQWSAALGPYAGTTSRGNASRSARRELMPSLVNTFLRCHSTVRGLRKSSAPISGSSARRARGGRCAPPGA